MAPLKSNVCAMDRSKIDHLPLFDTAYVLRASKHSDFQSRVLMRAQATAEVFSECGISKSSLIERFTNEPKAFRVNIGDLTDSGLEFARVNYQRWLANSDRWKGETTYSKFKDTLVKQWVKFSNAQP